MLEEGASTVEAAAVSTGAAGGDKPGKQNEGEERMWTRMFKTFPAKAGLGIRPALYTLLAVGCASTAFPQQSGQRTYASAGEACKALYHAVRNHDETALEAILGAGSTVTSSGDESVNRLERERFTQKYQEMHRLVEEPDGNTMLYVGAENWPFPIPLASSKNGVWFFDAKAGMDEIMFRRIGENEAAAMEVCNSWISMKKQATADTAETDPVRRYALQLAAADPATAETFHGYRFRLVGDAGKGKQRASEIIAYPVEYRSSGVMTFLVTPDGALYQRDLGPDTVRLAQTWTERKRASKWTAVK
jgi:hypothetical protein